MKCPHCGYSHQELVYGADDIGYRTKGKHGGFFESPVKLKRDSPYGGQEREVALYGCPDCSKTFIDI